MDNSYLAAEGYRLPDGGTMLDPRQRLESGDDFTATDCGATATT